MLSRGDLETDSEEKTAKSASPARKRKCCPVSGEFYPWQRFSCHQVEFIQELAKSAATDVFPNKSFITIFFINTFTHNVGDIIIASGGRPLFS